MTKWLKGNSIDQDVVISTRIRVARNINGYKFPLYMSLEESDKMTEDILTTMMEIDNSKFEFIRLRDLTPRERMVYVEEHLISPALIKRTNKSSFLLRNDEKATIMINEEDHIRIQTLLPGLNLLEGWELCSNIDDQLESKMEYAYHEDLGYLTSCPTNVGTGLRASVMVHLPCVSMTGHINTMIEALRKIGLTVRGIYGEGSNALGYLYQVSNQTTLGETEEEIIDKLNKVIFQIVNRERKTRTYLMEKKGVEIEDKLFRSLGILSHSRQMSSYEAMTHLSNIKLAYEMGYVNNEKLKEITQLMVDIQPATIQKNLDKDIIKEERDIMRAEMIRKYFSNLEG